MSAQINRGKADEAGPLRAGTPENGPALSPSGKSGCLAIVRPAEGSKADSAVKPKLASKRATGPRTPSGKERSKRNALKHGIFSQAVVLKGESQAEFQSLLERLLDELQPEGALEGLLVEKLATLNWRYHRLLIAERAEIQESTEFLECDKENQQNEEAEKFVGREADLFDTHPGLISLIHNPAVLDRCLELLTELREVVEKHGLNHERDEGILEKIYGGSDVNHLHDDLRQQYTEWFETSEVPTEQAQQLGYATPEKCKQCVLLLIGLEIDYLKGFRKHRDTIEANRMKLEKLRRNVPESPKLDRLLRYEASLERAFDRTLTQLERWQRMRRGQPVPPLLKVELSS